MRPENAEREREELVAEGTDTIPAAQRFLGLSRAKIYQLMESGELPYCKFGRARRIPRRALVEYAAKCLAAR
jgi:excisionase family DNA binding protein